MPSDEHALTEIMLCSDRGGQYKSPEHLFGLGRNSGYLAMRAWGKLSFRSRAAVSLLQEQP